MLNNAEAQLMDLYHNIFRMHSYLEQMIPDPKGERPGLLANADKLLQTSYARVVDAVPDHRRFGILEKPYGIEEVVDTMP